MMMNHFTRRTNERFAERKQTKGENNGNIDEKGPGK
jgi:hypothetical protein